MVNLAKAKGVDDPTLRGLVTTAEVSTLQLEFKYLSYLADDSVYWNKAEKVSSCRLMELSFKFFDVGYGNYQACNQALGSCSNISQVDPSCAATFEDRDEPFFLPARRMDSLSSLRSG
jgi:hypothetical protein